MVACYEFLFCPVQRSIDKVPSLQLMTARAASRLELNPCKIYRDCRGMIYNQSAYPIHEAAKYNDSEWLQNAIPNWDYKELEGSIAFNAKNKDQKTPLHIATEKGNIEAMKVILEKKAPVNAQECYLDRTPLHIAVKRGDHRAIQLLLEKGANVNAKEFFGTTPLHIAAKRDNLQAIQLLLDNGANVNDKNSYNQTPLEIAFEWGNHQAIQLLLKNDDQNIHNALNTAFLSRDCDSLKLLLEKKANVNITDIRIETPLHIAVRRDDRTVIQWLLEKGANVNAKNSRGQTPHDIAAIEGNLEAMELLEKRA